MTKLPLIYYCQEDVVFLAKDLIGKKLCTRIDGEYTAGIITETEAYRGWGDRACHAHAGKRTQRTEIMYKPGGVAYVYLCYGIHNLFNIITNKEDSADAVLIRAIQPVEGIEIMLKRRNKAKVTPQLTSGPGSMSQALGLSRIHYGESLDGETVWLENPPPDQVPKKITETTRIGIDYAGDDALLPWRFYNAESPFVSKR
ncbi:MAG: DNA-3-methyladenine glycosylase [Owenweeksia sp.]